MSANWNCRESRLRMTWAVYSIYSQRLQENLLVSKNSTHLAVLIHLLPMLFIQCIYILTDCSLPQLTIFSLRLFLEYKKHLIFNLHWFLVIPASRRKFSSHKGATMYKYQLTQILSTCAYWKYCGELRNLWLLVKVITATYLNGIICMKTSSRWHKGIKRFLLRCLGYNALAEHIMNSRSKLLPIGTGLEN